ncbi:MAG: HD domain-containing protein [Clostridiales bacterium]|jgi:tRNA nucleotidyltransferase/poly(A) polymerase|nr:HD domain-containing protein [Clostridiales bacterium]
MTLSETVPAVVRDIARRVPLYVVGGHVRNCLGGMRLTSDIDLCGPLPSRDVAAALPAFRIEVVQESLDTAVIHTPDGDYEYTPFRTESYPRGSGVHTPATVGFGATLAQDACRRDFSCNTVYYDIAADTLIDPHGGIADIERKVLRAVPSPEAVFSADGLRLMRLCRLAAETGYRVDADTAAGAAGYSRYLADITAERIQKELNKILAADLPYGTADAHYRGVTLLGEIGLWQYVIKEVDEGRGVAQNALYHRYDVYEHTLRTVKYAPPSVRLAALLHDVAKPYCVRTFGKMAGHQEVGADMTREILQRLKYPNAVIARTARLVGAHMTDLGGVMRMTKLRVFTAQNADILDDLVQLIHADGKATGFPYNPTERLSATFARLKEENVPFSLAALAVDGKDVMARGIAGRDIGRVLDRMLRDVQAGIEPNEKQRLLRKLQHYLR